MNVVYLCCLSQLFLSFCSATCLVCNAQRRARFVLFMAIHTLAHTSTLLANLCIVECFLCIVLISSFTLRVIVTVNWPESLSRPRKCESIRRRLMRGAIRFDRIDRHWQSNQTNEHAIQSLRLEISIQWHAMRFNAVLCTSTLSFDTHAVHISKHIHTRLHCDGYFCGTIKGF